MGSISINSFQGVVNSRERTEKALGNVQAQITTGLKNPNPATDPLASTLSKNIEGNISITKHAQSVVQQAKSTIEIAHGILRANTEVLNQMRIQAIEASNGTHNGSDLLNSLNPAFEQNINLITENAQATWGSRTLFDGTFSMNCQTSSTITQANISGSVITTTLDDGDLTVNGVDIGAVTSGVAKDIATAINAQTATTQVIASALTTATGTGPFSNIDIADPEIVINGVNVPVGSFAGTESAGQIVDQVVAAINADTILAGQFIVASNVNGYLQINATDGSNFTLNYAGISAQNVAGPNAGTYKGAVTLSSVNPITIAGNDPANAGFVSEVAVASGGATLTFSDMTASAIFGSTLPNLSTQSNAQAAITAIDAALTNVLNEMRSLSSYSKQFENIDENMAEAVLGLQDGLSKVQDTDFAVAIADLERLKVLSEVANTMLREDLNSLEKLGDLVKDSLR